ncbi:MAG: M20/M25/M40 family metallo-hydrolase [Phototrophicaceae bacterium]
MKTLIHDLMQRYPLDNLATRSHVLNLALQIQQIPAPTWAEEARAHDVAQRLRELGAEHVQIDPLYNVIAKISGKRNDIAGVLLSAHTDTVFPMDTDLTLRHEGNRIYGAGLGDNSLGVAGMLGVVELMKAHGITPECPVWITANSREEGLGDLEGIRAVIEQLGEQIQCVINIEGMAYGTIFTGGIASKRLRIEVFAEGGHSWHQYGQPSAVHQLVQLASQITQLHPPSHPKTTFNIGIIEGGHSINSIATHASLWLDMRSASSSALRSLEAQVIQLIEARQLKGEQIESHVVGNRPAGSIREDHPLVVGAMETLSRYHIKGVYQVGSTDGNIPLSKGIPTVTIGIGNGANSHRTDEYIEIDSIGQGTHQVFILLLATCQYAVQNGWQRMAT